MDGRVTIYALCDDSGVRYIGQTRAPLERRLVQHMAASRGGTALLEWCAALRDRGVMPQIVALQTTVEAQADAVERRIVEEHLAQGALLVNGTYTPATRRRISASMAGLGRNRREGVPRHPDDQREIRYTLRLPRGLYEDLLAVSAEEGYSLHAALLQAAHAYVDRPRRGVRARKPVREA